MPFISSPVAYPPTSSPSEQPHRTKDREGSPRKRRRLLHDQENLREPLRSIEHNVVGGTSEEHRCLSNKSARLVGGLIVEDEDSEDDEGEASDWRQRNTPVEDIDAALQRTTSTDLSNIDQQESKLNSNHEPFRFPHGYTRGPDVTAQSCSGKKHDITRKIQKDAIHYERIVAARSITAAGRAQKSYYGVDIHQLIEEAKNNSEQAKTTNECRNSQASIENDKSETQPIKRQMWTEKYRARKFTDLVGDERTHRSVLRWLKRWDPIVFPHQNRPKPKIRPGQQEEDNEHVHRKILLLTGPPGLGKTTLAHVCARQAGYEVQEINASDERSRDVVKGRIRDMVATENVKIVNSNSTDPKKKTARPICVVVDEVDGVVGGAGGSGDGGFVKALTELVLLDQKNSVNKAGPMNVTKRRKGDDFRMLRPLILICNDVYHPSLRLLRAGTMAEIVHVRKPQLNMVIPRLQTIFAKEGLQCDSDGVRHLCEATWGVSSRKEEKSMGGTIEGDIRGVLVVGEWVASKLRAEKASTGEARLTKRWLTENVLGDLAQGGGAARSLGRGGTKEVMSRMFQHNAGFPVGNTASNKGDKSSTSASATEFAGTGKQSTMEKLRQMIESSGDEDRVITDCFTTYPTHPFQDDTILTKPDTAYEWLHFHDQLSSRVYQSQEWELMPYLSHPALAFHHLFASATKYANTPYANRDNFAEEADANTDGAAVKPFSTVRASFEAIEAEKANRATLTSFQTTLSLNLHRAFRSSSHLAEELLPYILRLIAPDVKPVVVGGSEKGVASVRRGAEKEMVRRSVEAMVAAGVKFERGRVDFGEAGSTGPSTSSGMVYRMEPPLDALAVFDTMDGNAGAATKVRYAVRQVLEQEWKRDVSRREQEARVRRAGGSEEEFTNLTNTNHALHSRGKTGAKSNDVGPMSRPSVVKKDFFGRPIVAMTSAGDGIAGEGTSLQQAAPNTNNTDGNENGDDRIWVTYHEGYSNAVRKGITLKELMDGL